MALELLASFDGVIGAPAEARIPVTDEGLLRGDGVFEVLRLYDGRPFALDEHLARLERSGANLRLAVDVDAVRADVDGLLAAAGAGDGCLRIVLTRGGHRVLLTEALPAMAGSVRLACVTYAPTRILDGVKSLSYAANMLASRLAQERGFDEALLVTPHGRVLEAPTSTFFWASDGALYTPPLDDHILASITRAAVVELTGARERICTLEEIHAADEAFLASTVREVQAVAAVEDHDLPAAPGSLGERAGTLLREHIAAELAVA